MAIPIIKQVLKKDGKAAASFYEKACRFLARDKYSKTIVWENWHKYISRDSVLSAIMGEIFMWETMFL